MTSGGNEAAQIWLQALQGALELGQCLSGLGQRGLAAKHLEFQGGRMRPPSAEVANRALQGMGRLLQRFRITGVDRAADSGDCFRIFAQKYRGDLLQQVLISAKTGKSNFQVHFHGYV